MRLAVRGLCCLVILCPLLVGMGGAGNGPGQVSSPDPVKNYKATIVDQSDMSTSIEKFSLEGQTSISGKLGEGLVSISFDKITSMEMVHNAEHVRANIVLKDGSTVPVDLDKGMACYGRLSYGDFKINIEDVRSIVIHGLVPSR